MTAANAHSAPAKVLVVDDDFISLEVLKAMLSHYSVEIITAQSGSEAVAKTLAERPALLLLDQELPDFTGLEAYCKIVAELGDDAPLAAMISGHSTAEISAECQAIGIKHQLTKPVSPTQLSDLMAIASGI
ncbi:MULTISPECIES: response regulator [Idiomarina]|uniref:response regulator n=1 Tax=Idiomarina TaxID=135575 RepID=UPI00129C6A57|nr:MULTISPECIES: response regulator [Idiomarina]MRJ42431.1 response regulator [Idiomarina sp. FeN1]NCU58045.1 response regulator [Idiomarina sp. FenA--70]NCU60743.1 response regulator [Idiomarina sp. FenBw--71]UUN14092.1 response regulator [Idiomarina loihiensis]